MIEEGFTDKDYNYFWSSINKFSRYDTEEIIFFKRMLQRELGLVQRQNILNRILENIVEKTNHSLTQIQTT